MFVFITKTQTASLRVYLRFEVPVHDSHIVHVTDGRHQLPHDAAGLRLAEMLLSADPLQELPSTEQLQDQVRVELQQTQNMFTLLSDLCDILYSYCEIVRCVCRTASCVRRPTIPFL